MKAIDACPKAFCNLLEGMRNCYYDVHKWLNVVEVELNVVQMLIVMWEMHQSDWEKL